jgi:hypothetical protein
MHHVRARHLNIDVAFTHVINWFSITEMRVFRLLRTVRTPEYK